MQADNTPGQDPQKAYLINALLTSWHTCENDDLEGAETALNLPVDGRGNHSAGCGPQGQDKQGAECH